MNTTIQEYECNLPEPDTEAALNSIETSKLYVNNYGHGILN